MVLPMLPTISIWACMLSIGHTLPQPLTQQDACTDAASKVTDIYTFPLGTWVENIYRRQGQQYLVSLLQPKPDFYLVDASTRTASLVATLPGVSSMLGIAQGPRPDTYVVIGTNFSAATLSGQRGSGGLYTIDMSQYDIASSKGAKVELSLKVPNATSLDGLAAVDPSKGIYVAADLGGGVIYRLDIQSGKATVIVANEFTAKLPNKVGGPDGLKIRNGYIYWGDNGAGVFARVPISPSGYPTGATEKIADIGITDDFLFNSKGDAYLTLAATDNIGILRAGTRQVQQLPGRIYSPTAIRFGQDQSSLIISTCGNFSQYAGKITRPGKVVKLDLSC